jgi:hypothetical protein
MTPQVTLTGYAFRELWYQYFESIFNFVNISKDIMILTGYRDYYCTVRRCERHAISHRYVRRVGGKTGRFRYAVHCAVLITLEWPMDANSK